MNGIAVDLAKVSQATSERAKQLEAFGRCALDDITQIWMNVLWLGESLSHRSRPSKLNETRRLLATRQPALALSSQQSVLFWEYIRYATLFLFGWVNAYILLVRGIRVGLTYEYWFPLPEVVINWEGTSRTLEEQTTLIRWCIDQHRSRWAYKLAADYKPGWSCGLNGRFRQVPLKHIELAELHMLKAVAAYKSGNHPLHSVVQSARRSITHGSRWSSDEAVDDSLTRFVVVQMCLGDLLFEVARRWPDETAKTAPFLHKDNKHILELAKNYLTGALECASRKNAHRGPRVRKIMQKHGLLEAA